MLLLLHLAEVVSQGGGTFDARILSSSAAVSNGVVGENLLLSVRRGSCDMASCAITLQFTSSVTNQLEERVFQLDYPAYSMRTATVGYVPENVKRLEISVTTSDDFDRNQLEQARRDLLASRGGELFPDVRRVEKSGLLFNASGSREWDPAAPSEYDWRTQDAIEEEGLLNAALAELRNISSLRANGTSLARRRLLASADEGFGPSPDDDFGPSPDIEKESHSPLVRRLLRRREVRGGAAPGGLRRLAQTGSIANADILPQEFALQIRQSCDELAIVSRALIEAENEVAQAVNQRSQVEIWELGNLTYNDCVISNSIAFSRECQGLLGCLSELTEDLRLTSQARAADVVTRRLLSSRNFVSTSIEALGTAGEFSNTLARVMQDAQSLIETRNEGYGEVLDYLTSAADVLDLLESTAVAQDAANVDLAAGAEQLAQLDFGLLQTLRADAEAFIGTNLLFYEFLNATAAAAARTSGDNLKVLINLLKRTGATAELFRTAVQVAQEIDAGLEAHAALVRLTHSGMAELAKQGYRPLLIDQGRRPRDWGVEARAPSTTLPVNRSVGDAQAALERETQDTGSRADFAPIATFVDLYFADPALGPGEDWAAARGTIRPLALRRSVTEVVCDTKFFGYAKDEIVTSTQLLTIFGPGRTCDNTTLGELGCRCFLKVLVQENSFQMSQLEETLRARGVAFALFWTLSEALIGEDPTVKNISNQFLVQGESRSELWAPDAANWTLVENLTVAGSDEVARHWISQCGARHVVNVSCVQEPPTNLTSSSSSSSLNSSLQAALLDRVGFGTRCSRQELFASSPTPDGVSWLFDVLCPASANTAMWEDTFDYWAARLLPFSAVVSNQSQPWAAAVPGLNGSTLFKGASAEARGVWTNSVRAWLQLQWCPAQEILPVPGGSAELAAQLRSAGVAFATLGVSGSRKTPVAILPPVRFESATTANQSDIVSASRAPSCGDVSPADRPAWGVATALGVQFNALVERALSTPSFANAREVVPHGKFLFAGLMNSWSALTTQKSFFQGASAGRLPYPMPIETSKSRFVLANQVGSDVTLDEPAPEESDGPGGPLGSASRETLTARRGEYLNMQQQTGFLAFTGQSAAPVTRLFDLQAETGARLVNDTLSFVNFVSVSDANRGRIPRVWYHYGWPLCMSARCPLFPTQIEEGTGIIRAVRRLEGDRNLTLDLERARNATEVADPWFGGVYTYADDASGYLSFGYSVPAKLDPGQPLLADNRGSPSYLMERASPNDDARSPRKLFARSYQSKFVGLNQSLLELVEEELEIEKRDLAGSVGVTLRRLALPLSEYLRNQPGQFDPRDVGNLADYLVPLEGPGTGLGASGGAHNSLSRLRRRCRVVRTASRSPFCDILERYYILWPVAAPSANDTRRDALGNETSGGQPERVGALRDDEGKVILYPIDDWEIQLSVFVPLSNLAPVRVELDTLCPDELEPVFKEGNSFRLRIMYSARRRPADLAAAGGSAQTELVVLATACDQVTSSSASAPFESVFSRRLDQFDPLRQLEVALPGCSGQQFRVEVRDAGAPLATCLRVTNPVFRASPDLSQTLNNVASVTTTIQSRLGPLQREILAQLSNILNEDALDPELASSFVRQLNLEIQWQRTGVRPASLVENWTAVLRQRISNQTAIDQLGVAIDKNFTRIKDEAERNLRLTTETSRNNSQDRRLTLSVYETVLELLLDLTALQAENLALFVESNLLYDQALNETTLMFDLFAGYPQGLDGRGPSLVMDFIESGWCPITAPTQDVAAVGKCQAFDPTCASPVQYLKVLVWSLLSVGALIAAVELACFLANKYRK